MHSWLKRIPCEHKRTFSKHWNSFMCYMRTKEFKEFLGAEPRTTTAAATTASIREKPKQERKIPLRVRESERIALKTKANKPNHFPWTGSSIPNNPCKILFLSHSLKFHPRKSFVIRLVYYVCLNDWVP